MTTYTFHRADMWYPIELENDDEAHAHVELNPGTTKVVNEDTDTVVWEAGKQ